MKMYIAVLNEVPDHMVPVIVAHAVLRAHLEFDPVQTIYCTDAEQMYTNWVNGSFKKVVLRVNRREFFKIKELDNVVLTHENSTLDGEDCCAVLCPREEWPNVIKYAHTWAPKDDEVKHLKKRVAELETRISNQSEWRVDFS